MLAIERLRRIEELLKENGSVVISNLSATLDVSEETIRRDLEKIGKTMKIKRVRGGAFLPATTDNEVPIKIRETIYLEEKQLIGAKCVELLEDGMSVMLDSSTTAWYVAKNIEQSQKKITVITNSLLIASEFSESKNVKVISVGGVLRKSTNSFVGYMATDALEKLSADLAFVSCTALTKGFGATDNHEGEARIRKTMLNQSIKKVMIVDYTKFDTPAVNPICKIRDLDLVVTDREVGKEMRMVFEDQDVEVLVCK